MDLGLRGKRALVLASSSGLGYATARALCGEGAAVAVSSRDRARATAAATSIASETGGTTHALRGDVSDPQDIERLVGEAVEQLGGLDVLVCNAGGPPPGTFVDIDEAGWQHAFQLTLMSVVRSVRAALPHLRRSGGGSVLALASSTVKQPIDGLILSNVLRPAVNALCKTLANELAADGIRVNCLSPGSILTARIEQLEAAKAERQGVTVKQVRTATIEAIPLGRIGEMPEFGRVAAFLCSDAASYMTGSSVYVDGGSVRGL